MKTIEKLPKEIIKKYNIVQTDTLLMIHKPYPIGIGLDGKIKVEKGVFGTVISTSGAIITLYKKTYKTHITIVS